MLIVDEEVQKRSPRSSLSLLEPFPITSNLAASPLNVPDLQVYYETPLSCQMVLSSGDSWIARM